ncbi:DUF6266 family protein [Algoriphagus halophytocola]|uniref:DUF6266 family protein n=1 Tax=Algoriphagus halophytocola TaxID=2991499 RepID=A0ABY6MLE4_9BACT|nr:DUF6266 family protein [Algoriphagus sp. TR-M5]UZD24561.1 DUF6266 family protein [Algoriphagus sp. TR-M5]
MATLSDTSVIQPQGKVGGFTFYKLNGKIIMRSLPRAPHKNGTNPTPLQKVYQNRLAEVNDYLRPLSRVLDFGYQNYLDQKTGMNWAHTNVSTKGYNHKANPRINPAFLQISRGSLLGAESPLAFRTEEGISISWKDNSLEGNASEGDSVMILLNQPELQKHIWIKEAGRRNELQALVQLDAVDSENEWEVFLAFHRPLNTKKIIISDSIYLGRV